MAVRTQSAFSKIGRKAGLLAFCSTLSLSAGVGVALTSTSAMAAEDEIIVSARRRDESLQDVPVAASGQASGTQSTARQVGSALGIAVLGTVLFTSLGSALDSRLDSAGLPPEARDGIVSAVVDSAGSAIPGLDAQSPEVADAAREAFSDATRYAAYTAAGFLALGLLATLRLTPAPVAGRREDAEAERPQG